MITLKSLSCIQRSCMRNVKKTINASIPQNISAPKKMQLCLRVKNKS